MKSIDKVSVRIKTCLSAIAAAIFVLIFVSPAYSQWQWAVGEGSSETTWETGWDAVVDPSDNVYVVGYYQLNAFGVPSLGWEDAFIAKYDNNGIRKWVTRIGGSGSEQGLAIAIDGSNCLYVTGLIDDPSTTFYSANGTNSQTINCTAYFGSSFLAKYDNNGTLIWATYADVCFHSVAVDGLGGVYLTGYSENYQSYFYKFVPPAGTTIAGMFTGTTNFDYFVAKYDNTGQFQWVEPAFGLSINRGQDIAVNASGSRIFVTGQVDYSIDFGNSISFSGTNEDAFIVAYDGNGVAKWAQLIGSQSHKGEQGTGILVDDLGDVYVVGGVRGSISAPVIFYGLPATPGVPISPGPNAKYVCTYTSSGGSVTRDAFIAKYNGAGELQWAKCGGGTGDDAAWELGLDCANVNVTGSIEKSANFGTFKLTNAGGGDVFIVSYQRSNGVENWVTRAGGSAPDGAGGIAAGTTSRNFVTGAFTTAATFGSQGITSAGGEDIFVALYQGTNINNPDLYIQDAPEDNGEEPLPQPPPWPFPVESSDIWNCENDPNCIQHENPEYKKPGTTIPDNYLRVRIQNRGCATLTYPNATLHTYWTIARWPELWPDHVSSNGTTNYYTGFYGIAAGGEILPPVSIPTLKPGESAILTIPWQPPNPGTWLQTNMPLCLLARIVSSQDPMTNEQPGPGAWILTNVTNNNNIATRNTIVVDLKKSKKASDPITFISSNPGENASLLTLRFTQRANDSGLFFQDIGTITLTLGDSLYHRWERAGFQGHGFAFLGGHDIQVIDTEDVSLDGIVLESGEMYMLFVRFQINADEPVEGSQRYSCALSQYSEDGATLDGTMDYDIRIAPDTSLASTIAIEKTHNVLQGHYTNVSLTINNSDLEMGGFDFLLAYDASALTFTEAQPGELLDTCDWEYFTYRYGANGNCGDACPSGLLRLIALAETNNGPNHPSCYGPPDTDPHELARMTFHVTNDRTYDCQFSPIAFFWGDCGDNSLSSVDGRTLYLDRAIYDFEGNIIWNEEDDVQFPEDARIPFVGAPDGCLNPDPDKPTSYRFHDFKNGGIDIVCADSIDARGDINLNGLANEVADAIMLTNYFIEGPTAFDNHYEGSVAASDVNADGLALSVADLVYLIRIITGDALPYAKPTTPSAAATAGLLVNQSAASVAITAASDIGAACFVIDHTGYELGAPRLIDDASGMTMKYADADGHLRILIYSMDIGRSIPAGEKLVVAIPINGQGSLTLSEVQLSDYFGRPLSAAITSSPALPQTFGLHQNYPNPFNNATQITYELPRPTQVRIDVYNIVGQLVTTLLDAVEPAGVHSVSWNGADGAGNPVSSGVYFYRLTAGDYKAEKKMVLLK